MKKIISKIKEDERKLDLNVSKIIESTLEHGKQKKIILVKVLEKFDIHTTSLEV